MSDQVSLFSLTTSRKSRSKSFSRYPTRSPNSHLPTDSWPLCFTISSTFLSSSLAMISPATFLQLGLAISSFIASILLNSFCRLSFILIKSPASFSYWLFMYSLMYFSLSLKLSSMMNITLSLRFLNSSLITLYILELKVSTLMLMLAISLRTFEARVSRQCVDSILADQKLALYETKPVHISLFAFTSKTPLFSLLSSRSSKLLNLLS